MYEDYYLDWLFEGVKLLEEHAENEPIVFSGNMWHECGVCHKALVVKVEDHEEDCIWRKTVEHLKDWRSGNKPSS